MSSISAPSPWRVAALMAALVALGPFAIDMYLPALPTIGADLHASDAQLQATVAAFLAGMAVGQVIYGPLSDRVGRRPPILAGLVIFVVASVCCVFATSPHMLIASRVVQALGCCAGPVLARAIIRDQFGHHDTARMLALMTLIMGLAPILAPLGGGVLLAVGGWRLNFWVMAGYGLVLLTLLVFVLKESRSAETEIQARSENPVAAYLALLRHSRLVGYALSGALNGATLFTYISSSPGLLIGTYGISPSRFGLIFGLNAMGLIAGGQVNRMLLRRLTPDEVLKWMSLMAVVAAILLAAAAVSGVGERWTVLPMLFVVLSSYGFIQGNAMAGALNIDPRRSGSTSALMGSLSFGAGACASAIAGLFHDGTPRPMAVTMLICICGSALVLHGLALRRPANA